MNYSAGEVKQNLNLQRHPEGGFYKEIIRSKGKISQSALPDIYDGHRCYFTSIYFLLEKGDFSSLHRLKSGEVWYFHSGAPLTVYEITSTGELRKTVLGNNIMDGQVLQHYIEPGNWFGSLVEGEGEYSLAGCMVAPGFEFSDFEMADPSTLKKEFPSHSGIIDRLTR